MVIGNSSHPIFKINFKKFDIHKQQNSSDLEKVKYLFADTLL
jgi:hypothetical protein